MVDGTSCLMDWTASQSKGPRGCCSRSANHAVRRCWAWESVVSSCCHVGGGGVGGELLAHAERRDSDPAVAGQTAHPLTRRANRHCCSVLVVYEAIPCCLPRRRCFVHARSFTARGTLDSSGLDFSIPTTDISTKAAHPPTFLYSLAAFDQATEQLLSSHNLILQGFMEVKDIKVQDLIIRS
jgi:hypothetical protein